MSPASATARSPSDFRRAALLSAALSRPSCDRTRKVPRVCVIEGLFDQLVSGCAQGRLDFSVGGLPPPRSRRLPRRNPVSRTYRPAVRHNHPLVGARSFAELTGCDWAITNDDPTYVSKHGQALRDARAAPAAHPPAL